MREQYISNPSFAEDNNNTYPQQCKDLYENEKGNSDYVFEEYSIWRWVVIAIIAVSYLSCIGFIYKNRRNVAFHTRSPYLVMIGLAFLCTDSILNTFIFSSHTKGDVY